MLKVLNTSGEVILEAALQSHDFGAVPAKGDTIRLTELNKHDVSLDQSVEYGILSRKVDFEYFAGTSARPVGITIVVTKL